MFFRAICSLRSGQSKLERYMAFSFALGAMYHSSLDCLVRKLPYCPQSHVLFVKYTLKSSQHNLLQSKMKIICTLKHFQTRNNYI